MLAVLRSGKSWFQFNVHGSVNRKNILIYIQQDATFHSLFYLETTLHVSSGTTAHHQERANDCIYSIWYLSHRYCYLPLAAGSSSSCILLNIF